MIRIILASLALVAIFACGKKEEPINWKEGKFYYEEENVGRYDVTRQGNKQVEHLEAFGLTVEFDIEWLTDTTYTLQFNRIVEAKQKVTLPPDLSELIKTCTMSDLTDTSYVEIASSNLNNKVNYTTVYLQ